MAKLGVLLTLGPYQFENWETAYNISNAALDKGHEVQMFLYLDGVYNPIKYHTFPDWPEMPKDKFAELVKKGAKIIACGVCVNARGLEKGKDYIDGITVGGLPDFAQIVSEVDSVVKL
jgi:tRNA 2-thiouridine synthesizing protein D